nr:E3 ubiquitin-protein ligase RNFT1-like [Tanacetum cinerariifolium]
MSLVWDRFVSIEAAKQQALSQATIEKNKVEADRQFAEIMNALKALQPPTTLPEDTTTMIDTEKSDVEEAAITTPILVVIGEADLMLGSEGKSIERVSFDPPAGNKSVEKENIKSGITCEENCYHPYRRVVEQSHNMFGWHGMRLKRQRGIYLGHLETVFWFKQGSKRRVWDPGITEGDMLKQNLEDKVSEAGDLCAICQEKMQAPILLRCKHIFCE